MSKRILIVDDALVVRQAVRYVLEGAGYHVTEADNGDAALAAATGQRYDLIVTDLNMPGMNGVDLVGTIRRLPGYDKTPIFMLTTATSRQDLQRGKAAGVTAWIVKPWKPE